MTRHQARRGFTSIEIFVVTAVIVLLISLLLPAVQSARETARRTHCASNLSQIALALQNYEMAFETLPPGTVNATGPIVNQQSPDAYHMSWTVRILPYLELTTAYRRFDFQVGAYDRRNLAAQSQTVPTYVCPTGGSYAGCHAGREIPIDTDNDGCLFLNAVVRFDDVTDGCGYTIAAGEAGGGSGLGWASGTRETLRNTGWAPNAFRRIPTDGEMLYEDFSGRAGLFERVPPDSDPTTVAPALLEVGGFASSHVGGAQFAFCDGSVRYLNNSVDPAAFGRLGSRNDGALPDEI